MKILGIVDTSLKYIDFSVGEVEYVLSFNISLLKGIYGVIVEVKGEDGLFHRVRELKIEDCSPSVLKGLPENIGFALKLKLRRMFHKRNSSHNR